MKHNEIFFLSGTFYCKKKLSFLMIISIGIVRRFNSNERASLAS